jgi:MFS family permease
VPLAAILREPAVLACTCVVLAVASTLSMFEPVFALHLQARTGLGPARIGLVFAAAALANVGLHPLFGYVADKVGARRQAVAGLGVMALTLPIVARAWSFESAIALNLLEAVSIAIVVTPSLNYMADAVSSVGLGSFGVAYGLYNMVWGAGMLLGPAAGGYLFERMGFWRLALVWAPALALAMIVAAAVQSRPVAHQRT